MKLKYKKLTFIFIWKTPEMAFPGGIWEDELIKLIESIIINKLIWNFFKEKIINEILGSSVVF